MLEKSKILIVDDNPHNARSFQAILKAPEVEILTATSGEEALQQLLEHPDVTLILMDVQMPGLDGFETTELIRGQPQFQDIPILLITAAYRSDEFVRRGFRAGASDYITTPVDNSVLESKVNVFLTMQNQKRQLAHEIEARTQVEAQVTHLNAVLQAIRNVNQLLLRERDQARLIQGACNCLAETQGFYSAWIALLDGDGRATLTAQAGLGEAFTPVAQALARGELPPCGQQALQQAGAVVFEVSPEACPGCPLLGVYGPRTVMASRLAHDGRVYGLLVASFPGGIPANHQEQTLLAEVAADLAFALRSIEQEQMRKQAEETLHRGEKRFRALIENSADAISLVDASGTVLYNSPSYRRMLGYSEEERRGQNTFELVHPDDRERLLLLFAQMLHQPDLVVVPPTRIHHADGSWHWIEGVANNLLAEPSVQAIVVNFRDITERQQAEDALRDSEHRFRELFENMSSGVAVYEAVEDGQDFIFKDFNRAGELIYKIDREQVLGRSVLKVFPGIKEFHVFDTFQRVWKTGQPEHHPVDLYQDERIVGWRENYVYKLPSGEIVAVYDDVTERKQAEEALRESEERYRTLFESATEGILVADVETKAFRYANPAMCKMLGYGEDELKRMTVRDIHPKEDLARVVSEFQAQAKGGKTLASSIPCLRQDGTVIYADINTTVASIDGKQCNVGFFTDITERKQAGEALRDSEERYRTLFETMAQGVIYWAADGAILMANPAAERILGLALDQMQGRTSLDPLWRPIHEDGSDFPGETHPAMVALQTGQPVRDVVMGVFNPQDDDYRWIDINAIPQFRPGEDRPYQVYTTFDDITERKRAEAALQRRTAQVRLLFEAGQRLGQSLDLETVLDTVHEVISQTMTCDSLVVSSYSPQEGLIRCLAMYHEGTLLDVSQFPPVALNPEGQGTQSIAIRSGQSLLLADYLQQRRTSQISYHVTQAGVSADEPPEGEDVTRSAIIVPLKSEGRVIGAVQVFSYRLNDFDQDDLSFLEALSPQIAAAMTHSLLYRQAQREIDERQRAEQVLTRRTSQLALLNEVGSQVAATLDLDEVLSRAAHLIHERFGFHHVGLFTRAEGEDRLVMRAKAGKFAHVFPKNHSTALGQGIVGWVGQHGETLLANDVTTEPRYRNPAPGRLPTRSELSVPIRIGDEVVGVLDLQSPNLNAFDPTDVAAKETLAGQLAVAIHNARLYSQAAQRNRELTLLNRVMAATATGDKVESILEVVCRELALAFDVPQAAATLFNEARTEAVVVAEYLAPGRPPALGARIPVVGNPASQHLLTNKTPLVIDDAQTDPRQALIRDSSTELAKVLVRQRGTVSLLLLPLIVDGDTVGSLGVDAIQPRVFSTEEINLAWRVAEQVSGVLARARLREERRQLRDQFHQAQKMEAVGRLAGGVAHDFNNLLTVIHLSTRLMEKKLSSESPLWQHVQRIQDAGQRAAGLTKQLLAFSRREIVEPKVLDLNHVLDELNKMLWRLIGEDIELVTHLADGLWPIRIDPTQIEQVVVNLAVNARDAMPTGGRLTIETANAVLDAAYAAYRLEVEAGEYVLLAISDNGVGMNDEVKAHLFEPFFTTKERGRGTGLGLATVFGIVKQNKGHIAVYSEPGQGTTFKIYLPRLEAGAHAAPEQPAERAAPLPRGSETVMLVEDETQVREMVKDALVAQGYRVLTAQDGVEALQVIEEYGEPVHLLITDVVMPRLGGRALADQLRPRHPTMRVLFTSGYTDDAIVQHGVLEEGIHFLSKPFELEALARKVREVLDAAD